MTKKSVGFPVGEVFLWLYTIRRERQLLLCLRIDKRKVDVSKPLS